MPTPARTSGETGRLSLRSSCPPEDERSSWSDAEMDARNQASAPREVLQQATPPAEAQNASATEAYIAETHAAQRIEIEETAIPDMLSPLSATGEKQEASELSALSNSDLSSTSMGYDFSNIRLIPSSPSSFLRAGSRFRGSQQSERSTYEVQVEIKHVDMRESFLCGYLRIQGLTEDHPTLTTYFEGEIIGSKYTFLTQHSDWGSTDKVDFTHWAKFSSFRPYLKQAKRNNCTIPHLAQRENIFMRWKEQFLVPDHRVRTITGASFEGFYYICFNQLQGTVSGIYFHAKSEKFQQLELKHVEDHGCFPAMEFR